MIAFTFMRGLFVSVLARYTIFSSKKYVFQVKALEVGENICVEGYVMDYYCIDNGVLLDAPTHETLQRPDLHSIHCLVDLGLCRKSAFEVLVDPATDVEGDGMYGRGWRVSEDLDGGIGKSLLVDVARKVGTSDCVTCFGGGTQSEGFRAVMNATVVQLANLDTNIPTMITVHHAMPSNDMVSQADVGRITNVGDPCKELFGMQEAVAEVFFGSASSCFGHFFSSRYILFVASALVTVLLL